MPFDGNDDARFSPADLAALLRDHSLWPAHFVWGYDDTVTCAVGLAFRAAGVQVFRPSYEQAVTLLGMKISDVIAIFGNAHEGLPVGFRARSWVTPEHIADLLDKYVAAHA